MLKKEQILDLYFNKGYRQVDIAKEMGISRQLVSRIISKDKRYKKPVEKISKLMKNKNNYSISIPNSWATKLNLTEERKVRLKITENNKIIIEKYDPSNNNEKQTFEDEPEMYKKEVKYERQNIAIAEKIYNDVLEFAKHSQSLCAYSLVRKFKIGYTTAEYLIDKLNKEGLLEIKYGTYWVKNNN